MKQSNHRITLFFFVCMLIAPLTIFGQPNYPTDPKEAQLITTDLINFVTAYEQLKTRPDTLAVLQEFYFDKGSAGLKEYINRHQLTPELLKTALAENPGEYEKLSGFLVAIPTFQTDFIQTMERYHKVVPNAVFAPTYFLVGANRGIAQASKVGQLVTLTRVVDRPETLKKLIVHELSHFQQALALGPQNYGALYGQQDNMLGLCLREGGAEFITSLVLEDITQAKTLVYYQENVLDLKSRFKTDLSAQDQRFWLWESVNDPDTPHLMGYVIGYEICKAYYNQATDKKIAMGDILGIHQPDLFLAKSQYFSE